MSDLRLVPVTTAQALGLLATVHLGRIAYIDRALPSIQAVSHMIEHGDLIIRSHGRPPIISPARTDNAVLAYEADAIDPETFFGWRVTVTGQAGLIREPDEVARYQHTLPPWPVGSGAGQFIRLRPSIVTGYRFLGPENQPPTG